MKIRCPDILLAGALLLSLAAHADDATCRIEQPPATSGELADHASLMRVYPRRSALTKTFTGCQTVWLYDPGKAGLAAPPRETMRLVFRDGRVVTVRMPGRECTYDAGGKRLSGGSDCPSAALDALPSQPAGCLVNDKADDPAQTCNDDDEGWHG